MWGPELSARVFLWVAIYGDKFEPPKTYSNCSGIYIYIYIYIYIGHLQGLVFGFRFGGLFSYVLPYAATPNHLD